MSNIHQFNGRRKAQSNYGPVHPFKVIDVGGKQVMINRGSFYSLGQGVGEVAILGDLGNKMVDHLWNNHDSSKAITVKTGDVIYVKVTYADPTASDLGTILPVTKVELLKGQGPIAWADNEKIWEIARITKQEEIIQGEGFWRTHISQTWKSDVSDIFLGENPPAGTGGCSSFTTASSLNVMVGLRCEPSQHPDPNICCIYLTPLYRQISFCGEVGAQTSGTTIVCCCDPVPGDSSSSSSAATSSSSSSTTSSSSSAGV